MTKDEVLNMFPTVSPSAIHIDDDGHHIEGKFCDVLIFDDGNIDLFIFNRKNSYEGLSKRKLNRLVTALEMPEEGTFSDKTKKSISFTVVDGEAWINLDLPDLILNNLKVLGIRKKRELSRNQKQSLVEGLREKSV